MQNHNDDTIRRATQFFRKIHLLLYLKGFERVTQRFYCEREWETEQNCNILTTTLLAITAFLSRSPVLLNRGPTLLGAGFLNRILSLTDCTSCAPSYIIVRRPPSCGRHKSHSFKPSTVKVIFWYSSTGCTCYLYWCISYFDSPAGSEVNIQHFVKNLLVQVIQFNQTVQTKYSLSTVSMSKTVHFNQFSLA